MGIGSFFGGGSVDLSGAKGQIQQGMDKAIGTGANAGMPDGNGYLQAWAKDAKDNYVKPGLDQTRWAGDASKTALGGNGAQAEGDYWNGFMKSGPLAAALDQASKAQQTASNGQGLSNSGAATQALANTQARIGYQATQDRTANLFNQQKLAGQYDNMGVNVDMGTQHQIADVAVSGASALADLERSQALADQASKSAGMNNLFGLVGTGLKLASGFI